MTVKPLCVEFCYGAVKSVLNNTEFSSLGTWGLFLDSSHEHSGGCQKCQQLHGDAARLSKLPVSVRVSVCARLWSLVWLGAV